MRYSFGFLTLAAAFLMLVVAMVTAPANADPLGIGRPSPFTGPQGDHAWKCVTVPGQPRTARCTRR